MDHHGASPTWIVPPDPAAAEGTGPRLAVKDCIDIAGLPTTASAPVIVASRWGEGRVGQTGASALSGSASEKILPVFTSRAAATRCSGPIRFCVPR